jgi:hypothetical protein
MQKIKFILALLLIIGFVSCSKEKNENHNLLISTDKLSYTSDELVYVNISNHYENGLGYYVCSSYEGIPPTIWKFENDSWVGFWSPICDGNLSYCCGVLESKSSYTDTLNIQFENGTYKIEYSFIEEDDGVYQSFYSNEFSVD